RAVYVSCEDPDKHKSNGPIDGDNHPYRPSVIIGGSAKKFRREFDFYSSDLHRCTPACRKFPTALLHGGVRVLLVCHADTLHSIRFLVYIEASHAPVVYICNDNDDIKQPQEQEGRSERDENIEDDYGIDNHQSDTGFS